MKAFSEKKRNTSKYFITTDPRGCWAGVWKQRHCGEGRKNLWFETSKAFLILRKIRNGVNLNLVLRHCPTTRETEPFGGLKAATLRQENAVLRKQLERLRAKHVEDLTRPVRDHEPQILGCACARKAPTSIVYLLIKNPENCKFPFWRRST